MSSSPSCCGLFELENVINTGSNLWTANIVGNLNICSCFSGTIAINIYNSTGGFEGNGFIISCNSDGIVIVEINTGVVLENGFSVLFSYCESQSPSLSSLSPSFSSLSPSFSSISPSPSIDCCEYMTIYSVGGVVPNIIYYVSSVHNICDCIMGEDTLVFYSNVGVVLGTGTLVSCSYDVGTGLYELVSDYMYTGAELYIRYEFCESESPSPSPSPSPSLSPSLSPSPGSLSPSSPGSFSPSFSSLSPSSPSDSSESPSSSVSPSKSKSMSSISPSISSCSGSTIDSFTVVKIECYQYRITSGLCSPYRLTVRDYITGNYAYDKNGYELNDVLRISGSVIELRHIDGVYQVLLSCDDVCGEQCFMIYELCSLQKCYLKMLNYIMCAEPDPCCEPCDVAEIRKRELYRFELNKIIGFMQQLFGFIHADKIDFPNGFGSLNADRLLYVDQIKDIFSKLSAVVARCGCDEIKNACKNLNC